MQHGTTSTQSSATSAAPTVSLTSAALANGGLTLLTRITDEIAHNRPGLQTTEFTLVAALLGADVILTALGKVPTGLSVVFGTFSAAAYQWLRNNRKDARETSLLDLVDALMGRAAAMQPDTAGTDRTNGTDTTNSGSVLNSSTAAPESSSSLSSSSSTSGQASLSLLCLLSVLAATFLSGCAALAKFQADPRVQFAEQEALKIGVAALQQYSNGGSFDSVWGISEGLYAFTDTISAITAQHPDDPNSALAVQLAQTIQSYASTKDTKALAGQIAAIITKANPQTDAQRVQVVNAIAGQLQTAATITKPSDGKTLTSEN